MNMLSRSLITLGLLTGCAGASEAPPPPSTTPASLGLVDPAPTPRPPPPPPEVRIGVPACGYGGSAPAASVFVDVDTAIALHHVTVSFRVTDLSDVPIAVSGEHSQVVISPVERGVLDFSTQGTTPFDGTLAPSTSTRLELFAGLRDDPAAPSPAPRLGGPMRLHVTVRADESTSTATCDTEQMWPSS